MKDSTFIKTNMNIHCLKIIYLISISFLSLLISSCEFSEKKNISIPASKTNQICIEQYLKKIHYIDQESELRRIDLPIDIGFPQGLSMLEIPMHSNRDLNAVYKGIEVNCYPASRRKRYIRPNDWEQVGIDMSDVSKGLDGQLNKNERVYLEIDFAKNSYEIFQ